MDPFIQYIPTKIILGAATILIQLMHRLKFLDLVYFASEQLGLKNVHDGG